MMINSKIRFAVDDADGRIFCYLTSRYYPATGTLVSADGTWDLAKLKAAILAGESIETALVAAPATDDKIAQANADFEAAVEAAIAKRAEAGTPAPDAATPPAA